MLIYNSGFTLANSSTSQHRSIFRKKRKLGGFLDMSIYKLENIKQTSSLYNLIKLFSFILAAACNMYASM